MHIHITYYPNISLLPTPRECLYDQSHHACCRSHSKLTPNCPKMYNQVLKICVAYIVYNQYIITFWYYFVYIILIKWECIKSTYSESSTTIDLRILGPPALVTVTIFSIATTYQWYLKKIVIKTLQINYSIISNVVYTFYRNTYQHNHGRGTHFLYQEYARMAH